MNLVLRAVSALIAICILVTTLTFFSLNGAFVLILIIASLIASEISMLFSANKIKAGYLALSSAAGLILYFLTKDIFISILPHILTIALVPWAHRKSDISSSYRTLATELLVLTYCFLTPIMVFEIMAADLNFTAFYFFGLLVFGIDTFAYLSGKVAGKKLFKGSYQPMISPSKTIEGFLGSLLWPIILCAAFAALGLAHFSVVSIALIILTAFTAISGDLIASLIKRKSKKKDTSQLMPGHGGLLDRLDSLLLSAPFFLVALRYMSF